MIEIQYHTLLIISRSSLLDLFNGTIQREAKAFLDEQLSLSELS